MHHLLVMGVLEGMCPMGPKLQETTILKVLNKISNYILKQRKENCSRSSPVLPVTLHKSAVAFKNLLHSSTSWFFIQTGFLDGYLLQ